MAGIGFYKLLDEGEDDSRFQFRNTFFRDYVPGSVKVNDDARIGYYPAKIYGFWASTKCSICRPGSSKAKVESAPNLPEVESEVELVVVPALQLLEVESALDRRHSCEHAFTLYTAAKEIAHLLKCRKLRDTDFWVVAEGEWKKEAEAAQKIVDAKEANRASLISEIYQLVGLAAAFQGLLITAASQLSASKGDCGSRVWWLIALSLFATIVTATGVNYKVGLVRVFRIARKNASPTLDERKRLLMKLTLHDGPGFNLKPPEIHKRKLGKLETFLEKIIYPVFEYSTFILACLIVFGAGCGLALAFICK